MLKTLRSESSLAVLGLITALMLEHAATTSSQDWLHAASMLVGLGAGMLVGLKVAERLEG